MDTEKLLSANSSYILLRDFSQKKYNFGHQSAKV